ncbi:serine/threonine protein kinase [Nonomuraea glycinis]|uniref:serine/threonine protein kinase n=1 Tax=Nonomuraea glycinis TaxID=2047744 RepID=UPI002E11FC82|nr:protein kinase [Nonomuraea glycinis]
MRIAPRPNPQWTFNPPPGWTVTEGWEPPADWAGPEPHWPAPPPSWPWWIEPAHIPDVSAPRQGDPAEVGPYRIVGRLGAGGMGIVYAGVDAAGRRAAVKLIHDMYATNQEFRVRFRREVAMLRRVQGSCCVRMLAADADARQPWLATEYIAGRTLTEHVRVEGPLSGDGLYGLAAGLAEALVAVHAVGVVHRDLKPSNVMVSPQGPRLVDFGIARALDGTSLTATGHVIGSPGWVSPEEYAGEPAGPAADVYGWALVVVYAATGEQPYRASRPEALAHRVLTATVDTAKVPERLRSTVDRALAKTPGTRPSMDEVLAVVADAWRAHHGEPGPRTSDPATDVTARLRRVWTVQGVDSVARWGGVGERQAEPVRSRRERLRRVSPVVAVVAALGCAGVILLNVRPDSPGAQRPESSAATATDARSSPPASPVASVPETAADLAAALDLALDATPAATFSSQGAFAESAVSARASGSLLSRGSPSEDDFEMRITPSDTPAADYVVAGGDLYVDRPGAPAKSLTDQKAGSADWYALMVAGTAGPSVIHQLVQNSADVRRTDRTYSGGLPTTRTSGPLRMLLDSWRGGNVGEENDNSYLSYKLTVDADNRPTSFVLTWKVPVSGSGTYESEFATTYSGWQKTGKISKP